MIKDRIEQAIEVKEKMLNDSSILNAIENISEILINCYKQKKKTIFCGNGGSAADAQHLAAELSGKFYLDRPPIQAEACHVNSSFITAYSNDFHFENAYERYISSTGNSGDVLIAISTSGNSVNIINATKKAKELGMTTVGLTGVNGGLLEQLCDITIKIPSNDTPRIQEAQILIGHIICEVVENSLFG